MTGFLHPVPVSRAAALIALSLASPWFSGMAFAAEPFCTVQETCKGTNDNCAPDTGRLTIAVQPSGKARINLNDRPPLESTILNMGGQIILIFHDGPDEHQLRINGDGKFNYLISKLDETAPKGKAQILYRGQCQEGQ